MRNRSKKIKKTTLAAGIIIFLLIVIFLLYKSSNRIGHPEHTQLTFEGNVYLGQYEDLYPAISPDGKFIAYSLRKYNEMLLYVKDVSTGQSYEIFSGLGDINSLRWSPINSEILVNAWTYLNDSIWSSKCLIIPMLGGKIQNLSSSALTCWSPDGSVIAYIYHQSSKTINFIKRETSDSINSIKLNGDFTYLIGLDWSPVGDRLLFFTIDDYANKTSLWTIKVDGTQQQKIFDEGAAIYCCRWSSDGKFIYYLRSNKNAFDLVKVKISSSNGTPQGEPVVLQTGLQTHGFSLTSDNKKIAYIKYLKFSNLYNVVYNDKSKSYETQKLTSGTSFYRYPKLSPDGNKISVIHQGQVSVMPFEGGKIEQLTYLKSGCAYANWSPNGKELAFLSDDNVWTISSKGGTPTFFGDTESSVFSYISWLSDSVILYPKPGERNFLLLNTISEESKLLVADDSIDYIYSACSSPDGKKVAVLWYRNPSGLWVISLEDSTQTLLSKDWLIPLRWSNDEKWIYTLYSYKNSWEIYKISTTSNETKLVYKLPYNTSILEYDPADITSDGKKIIYAGKEINSDVWMIENFDPDVE